MYSHIPTSEKDDQESISFIDRRVQKEKPTFISPFSNLFRKIASVIILISLGIILQKFNCNRQISRSHENITQTYQNIHEGILEKNDVKLYVGLDIFVIGFPKCGTGTLRTLFAKSNEIAMLGHENKDLFTSKSSEKAFSMLESDFEDLFKTEKINNSTTLKRTVKNPQGVQDIMAIKRLVKYTDTDTKLVLGIRHPLSFYQSYCNYRIRNKDKEKRSHYSFDHCYHSFFNETRYDLFMKQLSKVEVTKEEKIEMEMYVKDGLISHFDHGLEIVPNSYKVLLYHVDQFKDDAENRTRSEKFRRDFQEYLELQNPIDKWPKNKVSHESLPEEMNICDEQFDDLREEILVNAQTASAWIKNKFIKSDEVTIAGYHDHFLSLLDAWNYDICP